MTTEGPFRRLARNRDFAVLWVGQAVSELGSTMSLFVFPLLTYASTGSAVGASVVTAALLVGQVVVLLPAGALVDRWNRKRVLQVASGSGALLYASLVFAQVADALALPHLVAVAFLTGVATSFYSPAEIAAIRAVVRESDLPAAMSQNQARTHLASLAGAPLGGALYSIARWVPFLFDMVTYAISCVAVSRIRTSLTAPATAGSRSGLRADIREGLAFVWRQPFLRVVLTNSALLNAMFGAFFLVLLLRMVDAGVHPAAIGATETAAGIGGVLGALAGPALIDRFPTGWLTITAIWVVVIAVLPLVFTVNPWLIGPCLVVALFLVPISNAGLGAYRVAITPDDMQGRTQNTSMFLARLALPVGAPIGGALMAAFGGTTAMIAVLCLTAASAVLLTASRSVRSVPKPSAWPVHHHASRATAPSGPEAQHAKP